jgi:hypothetical protein
MFVVILDTAALLSALAAAWLWFKASSNTVRRIALDEELNAQDFNRIVVSINRSQLLNRRAAMATAISACAIAAKFGADLVTALLRLS